MPLADPSSFLLAVGGVLLNKKYIAPAKKEDSMLNASASQVDNESEHGSPPPVATILPMAAMKVAAALKVGELVKVDSQNSSSESLLEDEKDLWSVHSVTSGCPGDTRSIFGNLREAPNFALNGFKDIISTTEHGSLPKPVDSTDRWMPYAIRSLSPLSATKLDQQPLELAMMGGFTKEFLTSRLGGEDFSTGLYYPAKISTLKSETYYLVDSDVNPFMPSVPGEHGAKLGVFFNDFDEDKGQYMEVPVFASINKSTKPSSGSSIKYCYMGTYSVLRWSDRLDFDRVQEVIPKSVKMHWAEMLANPHKPVWLESALRQHLWPRPEYAGPLPELRRGASESQRTNNSGTKKLKEDALSYLDELAKWEQESKIKVAMLTEANILKSFEKVR